MNSHYRTFGISRKNPGIYIAAVLMLLAICGRSVYYAAGGQLGRSIGGWVFLLVILPIIAAVIFTVELFVHGRDRLFKTGFAFLLGAVFYAARIIAVYREGASQINEAWKVVVYIVFYAAALIVWDLTVNAARIKSRIPAAVIFALPIVYCLCAFLIPEWANGTRGFSDSLEIISALLIPAALLVCSLCLESIESDTFRPRRGDRPDGRLIRSLDPMNGVAIYIMPTRNGAATYYKDSLECTKLEEYIRKKRNDGLEGFGVMHVLAASYVRMISQRPAINRFVSGQKVFSRGNEIDLAMAVKKDMTSDAPETIIKVCFSPEDTIDDVYRKYNEQILTAKNTPLDSGFDNLAWLINIVPGLLKKFLVWFLKCLDYFGFLPKFLLKLSPFHGTFFITSLGSLGIPPVYHHLYDFGNIPVFIAFGTRRTVTEVDSNGAPVRRKYMDYTVVTDERICDGFYYASAVKHLRRYLNNPEKLETPPEKVDMDVY